MIIKLEIRQTMFGRTSVWMKNGGYHRDNNHPSVIHSNGCGWWVDGEGIRWKQTSQ